MSVEAFSERVQRYLKSGGYSQKRLAEEIGLHPKVLSRKLHGTENAYLTQQEVRRIVLTLAQWHAISTREEALGLLELAGVQARFWSESDWQKPPLNALSEGRGGGQSGRSLSSPESTHNLPAPTTRLIGREWAVHRLKQLLAREDVRLLTLVGTGGSGKTRLALHLAREQIPVFPQGVWFVSLVGVSDPERLPRSIFQALQGEFAANLLSPGKIGTYFSNKQMLLVLDNFEQVVAGANVVAEILAAAPGVKILVTSRIALHIYGEYEFSVPPLDVPPPDILPDTASLRKYGALQLLVERAQAIQPDFVLTAANASILAEICAQLDGLPLALELAAARIKVLPPNLLLARLRQARLPLLTGGPRNQPSRLQTLRNTIAWSYNLLTPIAQIYFRRLSIFNGSWSLEAAEAMTQHINVGLEDMPFAISTMDVLELLVNHNLLIRQRIGDQQLRFAMSELIREYAREQLIAHGELELLHVWHTRYTLKEAAREKDAEDLQRPPQTSSLMVVHENYRLARKWRHQRARNRSSRPGQASDDRIKRFFVVEPDNDIRDAELIAPSLYTFSDLLSASNQEIRACQNLLHRPS